MSVTVPGSAVPGRIVPGAMDPGLPVGPAFAVVFVVGLPYFRWSAGTPRLS